MIKNTEKGIPFKPKKPLIKKALRKLSRMETGIKYSREEIPFREMLVIDMIQNEKNNLMMKQQRKIQSQMKKRGR